MHWLRRKQRERDLEREIRSDLELQAEELREAGLPPEAARAAAQRAFGNTAILKEDVREAWGWARCERLWQDVRYALRTFRNAPAFTAAAVLSLALGIGANTAIFTLLDAVLLRPLPVADAARLVQLTYTGPADRPGDWNPYFDYPHLQRFGAKAKTLAGIFGGVTLGRVNLTHGGAAGLAYCDAYSGNFFSVLGLSPQLGRLFANGDDTPGSAVVVLSDRFWRSRFAADPAIIGQTIAINQLPFTVIGVSPPGFNGLYPGAARDIWIPLHALDLIKRSPNRWSEGFSSWLTVAGSLAPDVSMEQAQAELDVLHRQLLAEEIAAAASPSAFDRRLARDSHLLLRRAGNGVASNLELTYARPLKLLLVVAGIILLISCANVANLMLARASQRRREIALRMALGAGRSRVVRQLVTESLLLAGAGGAAALAVAWGSGSGLVRMISTGETYLPLNVHPDWRVFTFTAAVSAASGILFGLGPALRGSRLDPGGALKEGSRAAGGPRRLDRALVAAQVMLSLVLVTGAGLFTRTLSNLRSVYAGSGVDHILMFSADARLAGYSKDRAPRLYRTIAETLAGQPGVESASVSIVRPVVDDAYFLDDRIHSLDGRQLPEAETIPVAWNALGPGYFATVGIPILLGRDFEYRDTGDGVIVSESLARRAFPGANPIGHRIDGAEVIGMVKDALYNGVAAKPRPVLYRPLFQSEGGIDFGQWLGVGFVSFEVRYRSGVGEAADVRRAVASVDRNLPIFRVKTLRAQADDSLLRERLLALLSACFGVLALLLACLGLYGLVAYGAGRRTAEIGIRMALGARRRQILWLVARETLWLVAGGVAAGVPLALGLTRYAKSLLFGVAPDDPVTLAVAAGLLIGVAALAAILPARRASRIDPMAALRYE